MAGKVNSTTSDIKKYEWTGYHKQGSIEDENFLNLSEKLEKIQESTDSQTDTMGQLLKDINKELTAFNANMQDRLVEMDSILSNNLSEIVSCLNYILLSINGGNN